MNTRAPIRFAVLILLLAALACNLPFGADEDDNGDWETPSPAENESETTIPPSAPMPEYTSGDKWSLWIGTTQLRGADIYQRVVIPDLDGDEFLGSRPFGPPFTQADFDRLAALGANYVNISGPGLFDWESPYGIDEGAVAHMDKLLEMAAKADMFVVITARSGPGRSPFAITRWVEEDDPALLVENIWEDEAAQQAYADMWRWTAERYRDNPIVVGYDLMCEPNSTAKFELWEPEEFYEQYGGTTHDWNTFHPLITAAIREVDPDTPILISAEGWGGVLWLPYLETTGDARTVYMVHQYEPQDQYTHQEPPAHNGYPDNFDIDEDGSPDTFDSTWLDGFLTIIDDYRGEHGVPVAVNEFGAVRYAPGAAEFMTDQLNLFDERGFNHALWDWAPAWEYWTEEVNEFNFRFGPDPDNISDDLSNDLMAAIIANWSRNTVRPSNWAVETEDMSPSPDAEQPTELSGNWWQPGVNTTWQWHLSETIDTSFDVDMYDVDLFDTETSVVQALKDQGRAVICYISVGSWEDWRPDVDQFPAEVIGNDYEGWPGEKWLDIRQIDLLAPIMRARLDKCAAKGFDGIEPDNIDGYTNDTGFPLTYTNQLAYNIWLAEEAHARGLSIGLKNDSEQVSDLLPHFDWAMTEDCFDEDWCEEMLPFIEAGKPVFAAEYSDSGIALDEFCPQANAMNISAILKNRDLDAYRESCP